MNIVWGIVTMEYYRNTSIIAVCKDYAKAEELAIKLEDWRKSWSSWPNHKCIAITDESYPPFEEWKRQCPVECTQTILAADTFGIEEIEFIE